MLKGVSSSQAGATQSCFSALDQIQKETRCAQDSALAVKNAFGGIKSAEDTIIYQGDVVWTAIKPRLGLYNPKIHPVARATLQNFLLDEDETEQDIPKYTHILGLAVKDYVQRIEEVVVHVSGVHSTINYWDECIKPGMQLFACVPTKPQNRTRTDGFLNSESRMVYELRPKPDVPTHADHAYIQSTKVFFKRMSGLSSRFTTECLELARVIFNHTTFEDPRFNTPALGGTEGMFAIGHDLLPFANTTNDAAITATTHDTGNKDRAIALKRFCNYIADSIYYKNDYDANLEEKKRMIELLNIWVAYTKITFSLPGYTECLLNDIPLGNMNLALARRGSKGTIASAGVKLIRFDVNLADLAVNQSTLPKLEEMNLKFLLHLVYKVHEMDNPEVFNACSLLTKPLEHQYTRIPGFEQIATDPNINDVDRNVKKFLDEFNTMNVRYRAEQLKMFVGTSMTASKPGNRYDIKQSPTFFNDTNIY